MIERLKADLQVYGKKWPDELETVSHFNALLNTNLDAFDRSNDINHITVSAFAASASGPSILMIWHNKLQRWLPPGGHVEKADSSLLKAATRELIEETGVDNHQVRSTDSSILDIDIHQINKGDCGTHFDVRFYFWVQEFAPKNEEEVRWVAFEELVSQFESSISRAAEKVLKRALHSYMSVRDIAKLFSVSFSAI